MNNTILRSRHLAVLLLCLALVLYGVDYVIFGHGAEIAAGFVANLAFLPIYVLIVTLMIERVLKERERVAIRQKLNMVIGVFFSEVGTALLGDGFRFLNNGPELAANLKITPAWRADDFAVAADYLTRHDLRMDSRRGDLAALREFLMGKRAFLLGLLGNPNLLEHDEFTDLLWAVFHLVEELGARRRLDGLPPADLDHLSGDLRRAYGVLLREWIVYLRHLQSDYPYLFSLAVRTNPLDPEARAEVENAP
jgi:hypothetical protein